MWNAPVIGGSCHLRVRTLAPRVVLIDSFVASLVVGLVTVDFVPCASPWLLLIPYQPASYPHFARH